MTIEIADNLAKGISKEELLLEVAVALYQKEKISLERAAKLAGIHRLQFQAELDKRKINLHYSIEEFDQQLRHLNDAGL